MEEKRGRREEGVLEVSGTTQKIPILTLTFYPPPSCFWRPRSGVFVGNRPVLVRAQLQADQAAGMVLKVRRLHVPWGISCLFSSVSCPPFCPCNRCFPLLCLWLILFGHLTVHATDRGAV